MSMLLVLLAALFGCRDQSVEQASAVIAGGHPARGREAIYRYGCASCHRIPGVARASGRVGPPLSGIAGRSYIAGVIANTPQNMVSWIRNPPAIDEKTAMPNLDVTEQDARDIASYLYTLREEDEKGWWR